MQLSSMPPGAPFKIHMQQWRYRLGCHSFPIRVQLCRLGPDNKFSCIAMHLEGDRTGIPSCDTRQFLPTPVEVNGRTVTRLPWFPSSSTRHWIADKMGTIIVPHCSFCYSFRTGGYQTFIRTLASSKPSKARSCLYPIEHCLIWSNLTNRQGVRPRELFTWGGFSSSTWRYLVGSLLPPSLYLIRLPVFSGTGLCLHNWLRVGDSRTVSCSHTRWGHPMFLRIYRCSKCQEAGRLYRTSSRISGGIPPQEHLHNTVQPPTHSSEHIVFPAHRRELQWGLNPLSPPQNTVKWDFHPPIYLHFFGAPNSYCTNFLQKWFFSKLVLSKQQSTFMPWRTMILGYCLPEHMGPWVSECLYPLRCQKLELPYTTIL